MYVLFPAKRFCILQAVSNILCGAIYLISPNTFILRSIAMVTPRFLHIF